MKWSQKSREGEVTPLLPAGRRPGPHEKVRVLNINRSIYYWYINRQSSAREQQNQDIRQKILEIYAKIDKSLGCRKIKQ